MRILIEAKPAAGGQISFDISTDMPPAVALQLLGAVVQSMAGQLAQQPPASPIQLATETGLREAINGVRRIGVG